FRRGHSSICNGTVVYAYNADGALATKIDAKKQKVVYTYDYAKRLSQIQRYTGAFQPLRVKAGSSAPNHPRFLAPNTTPGSTAFGQMTAEWRRREPFSSH